MSKRNRFYPLIMSGATTIFLAAQPLQAANFPVKRVKADPNYHNIALKLTTPDKLTNSSGILIASRGENLVIEIPTAHQPLILAQVQQSQNPGVVVPNPEVIIKDNQVPDASGGQPNPPYLPRAVAPPVGDMAVSNIDTSPEMIDLGTMALVPRLVLREAPAREVLAVLARYAGLNVIFLDGQGAAAPGQPGGQAAPVQAGGGGPAISLDLENEPVQDVFNSVLTISGLNANRRGRTIYISAKLPDSARNLVSRTIRLNQVKAANAATFLAGQGAGFQRVVIQTQEIVDPVTQRIVRRIEEPAQLVPLALAAVEGSTAPVLLSGLTVSADDRLNSITLIGEPRKVAMATSLLIQLDARRRQVAVNVKVIDINLDNTFNFGTSFSFGINDTGVINQGGIGIINFGTNDNNLNGFPPFGSPNPGEITPFSTDITSNTVGSAAANVVGAGNFNVARAFLAQLQASIQNNNAKILTDPTLIVQEGQEATVKLTQNILESVKTEVDALSGVRTITPVLAEVGLTLTVNIDRVDDNGFVALSVSPTVSAPGNTIQFDSGDGAVNTLNLIQKRALSSGLVRLRDDNTLVLSGIIQELQREVVSKIPILGDLPLIGSLFRSTSDQNQRSEVVILLTPQIIDEASQFGYNYTPGKDAAEVLRNQGFPVQGNP